MTVGVVMAAPLFLQWWLSTLNYRKWDGRRRTRAGCKPGFPKCQPFPISRLFAGSVAITGGKPGNALVLRLDGLIAKGPKMIGDAASPFRLVMSADGKKTIGANKY
jgi:hypothetical protein